MSWILRGFKSSPSVSVYCVLHGRCVTDFRVFSARLSFRLTSATQLSAAAHLQLTFSSGDYSLGSNSSRKNCNSLTLRELKTSLKPFTFPTFKTFRWKTNSMAIAHHCLSVVRTAMSTSIERCFSVSVACRSISIHASLSLLCSMETLHLLSQPDSQLYIEKHICV